jgi:hypothetical protein
MNTLALGASIASPTTSGTGSGWDLTIADGSLVVSSGAAALAQNVATALSTFRGEVWYDTVLGVPWLSQVLARRPSLAFVKGAIAAAAQAVPGVASVKVFLTGPDADRVVGGQVQLFSATGEPIGVVATTDLAGALPWYVLSASPEAAAPPVLTGGGDVITGGGGVLTP